MIFIIEAAWVAFSARYPMAFDEAYHVGIISLYSHQLSPLFAHQPPGPAPFGALTRDPSYLYHWLMSFPYRWLGKTSFKDRIITLRLINVLFFAFALMLWRKVMLRVTSSAAVVHVTLLFFILIPVVPQLAGQVNYDNLQMLLVGAALLLALRFRTQLLDKKKIDIGILMWLLIISSLACLVKFTFLPLLTGLVVYLIFLLWRQGPNRAWKLFQKSWGRMKHGYRFGLSILFIGSSALFIQMYGVNIIRYHNIIPQCGQVLSVPQCLSYGPWARNYLDAQAKVHVNPDPIRYSGTWLAGMFERSFFAINGPGSTANYENHLPLPIMSGAAILVFVFGFCVMIRYGKRLTQNNPGLAMLLFVCAVYLVSLWARNYHDYLQLGQAVALNGRYLLPIILPLNLAIALAYKQLLIKKRHYQSVFSLFVLACFLQGGGTLSYIYASNNNWYWPNDTAVQQANHTVQSVVKPLIVD